jgi:hypothetical protein
VNLPYWHLTELAYSPVGELLYFTIALIPIRLAITYFYHLRKVYRLRKGNNRQPSFWDDYDTEVR